MDLDVRMLGADDIPSLLAADVFDHPTKARWSEEYLRDPRHHIAAAFVAEKMVGFATGIHYVHPDKPPELFIAEVGVSEVFRRQGIATRLLQRLMEQGRSLGCQVAWVATEGDNTPARALYRNLGGTEEEEVVVYTFSLSEDT